MTSLNRHIPVPFLRRVHQGRWEGSFAASFLLPSLPTWSKLVLLGTNSPPFIYEWYHLAFWSTAKEIRSWTLWCISCLNPEMVTGTQILKGLIELGLGSQVSCWGGCEGNSNGQDVRMGQGPWSWWYLVKLGIWFTYHTLRPA
jgi:hypothetical protein